MTNEAPPRASRARQRFFVLASLLFAGTAVFHVVAMARSGFTPRHLAFVGINVASASLCLTRPRRWFPLYFFVLSLQQIHSHGADLLATWRATATIDWVSLLVMGFLPVVLALALAEERAPRGTRPT
jgi:hypothetical protein